MDPNIFRDFEPSFIEEFSGAMRFYTNISKIGKNWQNVAKWWNPPHLWNIPSSVKISKPVKISPSVKSLSHFLKIPPPVKFPTCKIPPLVKIPPPVKIAPRVRKWAILLGPPGPLICLIRIMIFKFYYFLSLLCSLVFFSHIQLCLGCTRYIL